MHMNENVSQVIAQEALAFYRGDHSSDSAFYIIDDTALSVWNYYAGIINDTREVFDIFVGLLIDFDVDDLLVVFDVDSRS